MKKLYYVLGVMLCCVLFSVSVRADVIWEPDDSFYKSHSEECTYVNRQFTANGPDGKVILYKSPELPIQVDTWENGYQVYISFVYTDSDGIQWGVYEGEPGGWMPMAYMEVVYDSISFSEEHSAELMDEAGELDAQYLGKEIRLWKYPGSEEYNAIELGDYAPSWGFVYVDGRGQRWGWVGYYFGLKNVWVCIDQPTADFAQLYPDGAPEAGGKAEDTDLEDSDSVVTDTGREEEQGYHAQAQKTGRIVPKMNQRVVWTAVILVALVVLITAALLLAVKKRRH